MKSISLKAGYTLIEIMVVLAITAIIFSIGFLNFQDYSRQQALSAVVKTLQIDIKDAQENAIAGKKPSACSGVLDGYQFQVISASSYSIEAYCSDNVVPIKSVTLPADFTMVLSAPNPIKFKALGQGTNIATGTSATITVTQVLTGNTRATTIGENGNVE